VRDDSVFKKYGAQLGLVGTCWSGQEHRVLSGIDGALLVVGIGEGKLAILHIVGNRDWALGCGIPFIEKLARRTLSGHSDSGRSQGHLYQSPWEERLAEALQQAGINAVLQ
jgi:hypothetical protein